MLIDSAKHNRPHKNGGFRRFPDSLFRSSAGARVGNCLRYRQMCEKVADALAEVPGIKITLEHDPYNYLIPHSVIRFTEDGAVDRDTVYQAMAQGAPQVYLHNLGDPDNLAVDPFNVDDDELDIVIRRLREVMLA